MAPRKKQKTQGSPVNKKLQAFRAGRKGRSVNYRIDGFDKMEGPVRIVMWTRPPDKKMGELVFDKWVHGAEFVVGLNAGQKFPVSVRGLRLPMRLSEVVFAKETRAYMYQADPETWTEDAYIRGDEACHEAGFCMHEANGHDYVCPRPIDIPAGMIYGTEGETIVLREDGPPVPESLLDETRLKEAQENKAITARVEAQMASKLGIPVQPFPSKVLDPPAVPLVYGGTGPTDDAIGPRTGA